MKDPSNRSRQQTPLLSAIVAMFFRVLISVALTLALFAWTTHVFLGITGQLPQTEPNFFPSHLRARPDWATDDYRNFPQLTTTTSQKSKHNITSAQHAFASSETPTTTPYVQSASRTMIIASRTGDDTAWLNEHFPDWQVKVYIMDDPTSSLNVSKNKGHEAAAYLTYVRAVVRALCPCGIIKSVILT